MTLPGWIAVGAGIVAIAVMAQGVAAKPSRPAHGAVMAGGIYAFRVRTIDGASRSLVDYRGKTLLIVNTASKCGNTPQYKSLETLYEKYKSQGFEVLAFPANNFGSQEPGTNEEIKTFCSVNYKTRFPLFAKISVKGEDIDPLYRYLTTQSGFPGDVTWNFAKFLVAPDGRVVARYAPKLDPLADEVTQKIDSTLAPVAGHGAAH